MSFKLKRKGEILGINEELSSYSHPVFEKNLEPGVIAEANRDGTTFVNKNASTAQKKNAIAHENTVAIRIVNHHFCTPLIKAFVKPLISTSANISGATHPQKFSDIDTEIITGVDNIIELDKDKVNPQPSRIIKIEPSGEISLLRS